VRLSYVIKVLLTYLLEKAFDFETLKRLAVSTSISLSGRCKLPAYQNILAISQDFESYRMTMIVNE